MITYCFPRVYDRLVDFNFTNAPGFVHSAEDINLNCRKAQLNSVCPLGNMNKEKMFHETLEITSMGVDSSNELALFLALSLMLSVAVRDHFPSMSPFPFFLQDKPFSEK